MMALAAYLAGVLSGLVAGVAAAHIIRRPAVRVRRCRREDCSGPVSHIGLRYDSRGEVEVILLCCEHIAEDLWEHDEAEDAWEIAIDQLELKPQLWEWPPPSPASQFGRN